MNHLEADLLVCLRSLYCYMTWVHLFRAQADGWSFPFRSFWVRGPSIIKLFWSSKAAPDHDTITTMFDWWYDVLYMIRFFLVTGRKPCKLLFFFNVSRWVWIVLASYTTKHAYFMFPDSGVCINQWGHVKSVAIALIALEGIKNKGSNEIVWREDI